MDENDLASDFSAIPNLLELIKNDEGLQQIFQEMGDFAKGAVLGNTTDLVGFPVQALGDALNAMGLPVGDKPVGGTNWLREQLNQEQPADESLSQTLGGLVGMPDPQSLASTLGLVGAIRRGGDPNLFAWHSTRAPNGIPGQMESTSNLEHLAKAIGQEGVLSAPSVGISKADPFAFSKTPTYLFKPDVLEQFKHQLFNRDAYTMRRDQIEGDGSKLDPYAQRMVDARFTEGTIPSTIDHILSIAASPNFRNFEEFENSAAGAKALTSKRKDPATDVARRDIEDALFASPLINFSEVQGLNSAEDRAEWAKKQISWLKELDDPEASKLLNMLETGPSDYAEYKAFEDIPLISRTLGGILVPQSYKNAANFSNVQTRVARRGLELGTPKDFAGVSEKEIQDMAEFLAASTQPSRSIHGGITLSQQGRNLMAEIEDTDPMMAFNWSARNQVEKESQAGVEALVEAYKRLIEDSALLQNKAARELTK